MNVASLKLCQELYELSGWQPTEQDSKCWYNFQKIGWKTKIEDDPTEFIERFTESFPAYDLGYLLRRLPTTIGQVTDRLRLTKGNFGWYAQYDQSMLKNIVEDTPEDAVAQLCIELFKQGILKKP